jgi:serralysin
VIESLGATSLVQTGSNYYLNPVGGGTGPVLKYQGAVVTAGQFGGWTPIGVETTANGYEVAWRDTVSGQYTFWYTDSNGAFTSNGSNGTPVAGNSTTVLSFESSFHQDLNGDGTIGQQPIGSSFISMDSAQFRFNADFGLQVLSENELNVGLNEHASGCSPTGQIQLLLDFFQAEHLSAVVSENIDAVSKVFAGHLDHLLH